MTDHSRTKLIQRRAELLQKIRQYFHATSALEVDVPVLGTHAVTDPHLQAISASVLQTTGFLQTSPEYFMKRLLAEGCGDIFYLGKAFRNDEKGSKHNPEFTMLEWYRLGFNDQQLMTDITDLLDVVAPGINVTYLPYQDIFEQYFGINPHMAEIAQLQELAKGACSVTFEDDDKSTWLDLLFSHVIEPTLTDGCYFVYDYPACQCALAKLQQTDKGYSVAKRVELFWQGHELANGYWELTDVREQRERFAKDLQLREQLGLPAMEVDMKFITALEKGLPECAGVALGVDRLLMCLLGEKDIREVLLFAFDEV